MPDDMVIYDVLMATNLVGAPFHFLKLFQTSCLVSFPALERAGLTMNDTLRLYIAAYQQKHIWKQVWKSVRPMLSIQIIKDVEKFVNSHAIDHESVISVILYGTSVPPVGASLKGQIIKSSFSTTSSTDRCIEDNSEEDRDKHACEDVSDTQSVCSSRSCNSSKVWCIADLAETRKQATMLAAQRALAKQQKKRPYKYVFNAASTSSHEDYSWKDTFENTIENTFENNLENTLENNLENKLVNKLVNKLENKLENTIELYGGDGHFKPEEDMCTGRLYDGEGTQYPEVAVAEAAAAEEAEVSLPCTYDVGNAVGNAAGTPYGCCNQGQPGTTALFSNSKLDPCAMFPLQATVRNGVCG